MIQTTSGCTVRAWCCIRLTFLHMVLVWTSHARLFNVLTVNSTFEVGSRSKPQVWKFVLEIKREQNRKENVLERISRGVYPVKTNFKVIKKEEKIKKYVKNLVKWSQ